MKRSLLVAMFSVWIVCSFANDTLTRAQVYNFNVGDTFDYAHTTDGPPGFPLNGVSFERNIITGKYYSLNNDTLFFTINRFYSNSQPSNQTLILTELGEREIYLDSAGIPCSYVYSIDTNSKYGGRIVNGVRPDLCFEHYYIDSFADGLGKVYSCYTSLIGLNNDFVTFCRELIYYSQGTERWGTPRIFTSVEKVVAGAFSISPNPATTSITLQLQQTPAPATAFQLFDITGRMVLQKPLTEITNRIELNGVSKGMYLYNVFTEGEKAGAGKLIIE